MRLAAGTVAFVYLAVAWYAIGAEAAFKLSIFLVLPLGMIWFSEPMGAYTGPLGHATVASASPAWMVVIGGWVLLLLPLVIGLIFVLS